MTINEAMRTYRLPNPTTPEDLECRWSKILNFGDKVLLAGYYYISQNKELSNEILKYEAFTDIEYNQAKSVACQARACAKYKYLYEKGLLEEFLSNPHKFIHLY